MQTLSTAAPLDDIQSEFDPAYRSVLLAVDSSDHSNRATEDAIEIANLYSATVTASHVYAAQMHDLRFRQMEGGLPEQFREEDELERQRDIHDSLITKGLSIITDSYLIQTQETCKKHQLKFRDRSLEGKNYKMLADEANNGQYDLLVMGALGLGALPSSTIGTVCERVTRRCQVDTLIIKNPTESIKSGPIVVAIDGSKQSYAGLITAFELATQWSVDLHVVSAFDPYYHYVAFNRIANVLTEEAGKVFRFKEQEQLHEEIIDDGLAKIYQGHLEVAEKIADDQGIKIESHLLTGKPHHAIEKYLEKIRPSLLIMGKIGIHADDELDIGGNTENLLRNARCALLLTTRQHTPQIEMIAEATTSWSTQAEEQLQKIPPFVQNMARAAILRYAQEQGHTVITASIVEQATKSLCPVGMGGYPSDGNEQSQTPLKTIKAIKGQAFNMRWSTEAEELLNTVNDATLRHNTKMRAEKKALHDQAAKVEKEHILPFVVNPQLKQRSQNSSVNSVHTKAKAKAEGKNISKCPFAKMGVSGSGMAEAMQNISDNKLTWTQKALDRLAHIPQGTSRDMTRKATEAIASQQDLNGIDLDFLEQILGIFSSASQAVEKTLSWDEEAEKAISKAPAMVQGMLIKEIEAYVKRENLGRVELPIVEQIKSTWNQGEQFHLDPDDSRNI